jgi:peroxiredoxin Q/BCP
MKLLTPAPNFRLADSFGVIHTRDEYKGSWLLLYFYPKDSTPGCTKEACSFRDRTKDYAAAGVQVVGISKDSMTSHQLFTRKYHLSFSLLSDPSTEVIKAYGAWGEKKFMGRTFEGTKRISFLINPQGCIQKEYTEVNVLVHADEVLQDIRTAMNSASSSSS